MKKNFTLCIIALLLFIISNGINAQTTYYVSTGGSDGNNGTSWATAFRNLTTALASGRASSSALVIINVASGTYTPAEGLANSTDRDAIFKFYRAEPNASDDGKGLKVYGGFNATTGARDIMANPTILSGDIGVPGDNSDNCYHVGLIGSTGFLNYHPDSIIVDGFVIRDGLANGSGLYSVHSNLNLSRSSGGGLVVNTGNGKLNINSCVFTSNNASNGGAIYAETSNASGHLLITHSVFSGNNSNPGVGGAIRNSKIELRLSSCIFSGNNSAGGGTLSMSQSTFSVSNCTFSANNNHGCFEASSSNGLFANNIIWGNNNNGFSPINATGNVIQYNDIEPGGTYPDVGNVSADPSFKNSSNHIGADNEWGTLDDGLQLNICSPAVNSGSNDADKVLTTTDIIGAVRIQHGVVDMGAYESSESPQSVTYYHDADTDGYGDDGNTTIGTECSVPSGYIINGGDCNDNDPNINPHTVWVLDNDNDGYYTGSDVSQCTSPGTGYVIKTNQQSGDCDDNNAAIKPTTVWYKDADNDSYSDGTTKTQCTRPTDYKLATELTATTGDCDDNNPTLNPTMVWYKDADNDGYSDGTTKTQCTRPTDYKLASQLTAITGDCNDNDATVHNAQTYYLDFDKDGYGNPGKTISVCSSTPPAGYVTNNKDCNDNDAAISPVAVEVCGNKVDDNCDGVVDEKTCYPCQNATNLNTTNITSNSAQLNWSSTANPQQWQLQYKTTSNGSKWIDVFLTGNIRSVKISGLPAKQSYNWHVHAKCNGKWTDYSGTVSFTTAGSSIAGKSTQQLISAKQSNEENPGIKLYPNPTSGQFAIELHLANNISTNAKIELLNMMGQTVSTINASINNGTLYKNVSISSSLAAGMYIARITVNNKTYLARVVYQK